MNETFCSKAATVTVGATVAATPVSPPLPTKTDPKETCHVMTIRLVVDVLKMFFF